VNSERFRNRLAIDFFLGAALPVCAARNRGCGLELGVVRLYGPAVEVAAARGWPADVAPG
jgi:hypothetical protein